MTSVNKLIETYTNQLHHGDLQLAYKTILGFLGKLRSELSRKHPDYEVSGIYQGYMDMSYFSMSTKSLKDKGLKIAIVYIHEKGDFEIWLSARNRETAKRYASILKHEIHSKLTLFHELNNPDAILECVGVCKPDFDDQTSLMDIIDQGVEEFLRTIDACL
jgi:hypothetical protein